MARKMVVVGGVAAGMSAAAKAKRTDPELEVVVYERTGYVSYGGCGLPYFVAGLFDDPRRLVARTPEQFARQGIRVHIRHQVEGIDPERREVRVRNLETGEAFVDAYDVLVLTTGGRPARPPIPGLDLPGAFPLRTVEDGIRLRRFLEREGPRRAVILGGGYIGVEMAEALRTRGLEVTIVEALPQILPGFDPEMAERVREHLEAHGVSVLTGHPVTALEGRGRVERVQAGDRTLEADLAVIALGVKPNAELAREAGIALGATGAVAVDERQRTNLPDHYAAGDVAEVLHRVTGEPAYLPLGTTANKQGRVAGANAAGGHAVFKGVVGTAVFKAFELGAARTGLSEAQARARGWEVKVSQIQHGSRAHYYPGGGPVHVRLIYRPDGRLVGGQIVGPWEAVKRIDVLAAALQAGWTVQDLRELDLAYAPPFSPVWDPLLVAANVAR